MNNLFGHLFSVEMLVENKYFLWGILFIILIGSVQSTPVTECTQYNSSSCQEPYYADDQHEYLYDLDSTAALEGGGPSGDGPSVFFGSSVFNNSDRTKDNSPSSGTVNEAYINNAGSAEGGDQNVFGRGEKILSPVTITGQKVVSDAEGEEYGVTAPYSGMCGDGQTQSGETTVNCPEDKGLPDEFEIGDAPDPSGNDLQWDNTCEEQYVLGGSNPPSVCQKISTFFGRIMSIFVLI